CHSTRRCESRGISSTRWTGEKRPRSATPSIVSPQRMSALPSTCRSQTERRWTDTPSSRETRFRVYARPRVAILTTGDEVVPPGKRIRAGQVYDINSHTIASVVRENGGEPVLLGRVPDRLEALHAALKKAIANDLVVVSGGSSVGEKDIVVDVLRSMGDLLFHGIAVKPGRP